MLSSPIVIRRYEAADAEMVQQIERMSIGELTPFSQLSRYYQIFPECFLVAEAEGKAVGYLVANMHLAHDRVPEGHILAVAVHPAYRRNGVGRQLLTQISSILKAGGASRIRLEVKTSNPGAKEFYLREGFEEVGLIRGYYRMRGYREDALVMVKHLPTRLADPVAE